MQRTWPVLVAAFGATYTFSIGNVTAPRLGPELGASRGEVALVLAAFAVSFAAGLILAGRLGDRYGRRRLLTIGLVALALTSALAAAAPGVWWLVAARVLQGAASAIVTPQTLAIIQTSDSVPARARGLAAFTAGSGVGTVAGQVVGGLVMGLGLPFAGWRGAVLTSALPGVVALLGVRRIRVHAPNGTERPDLGGALRVGIPLLALVAGLSLGPATGWTWWTPALVAMGLLGLYGFWLDQGRRELAGRPVLVAPSSLRPPALRLGLLMAVLLFAGYGAFSYEYSMLTQVGLGLTPVQSGLALAAFAGAFALAGLRMPHITARFGDRTMELAAGLLVAGLVLLGLVSWFTQGMGAAIWVGCFEVIGVLLGLAQASQYGPLVGTVMAAVPHRVAGLAGGLFTTAQQASLALGVATIGGIFGTLAPPLGWERAFAVALGVQVVTTVLFWVLARRLRRRPRGSDAHCAPGADQRHPRILNQQAGKGVHP
ncbi:MFS transporter [Pseudonocardia cypriaca]|uniref:MFS transporter n=1 Tax=Pseudonocardia cypriaca TaxID=882449 RepID=A0A543FYJ8_9PSEU|nr:MFS transporter [Pseudonocardia cypriaca]TQM38911.1 MFS transporter [Pseudonocardia cypriaca]